MGLRRSLRPLVRWRELLAAVLCSSLAPSAAAPPRPMSRVCFAEAASAASALARNPTAARMAKTRKIGAATLLCARPSKGQGGDEGWRAQGKGVGECGEESVGLPQQQRLQRSYFEETWGPMLERQRACKAERDKYPGAWPQRQTMSPRGVIWDSQATRSTNMCRRCSTPTVTTVMSTLRPCTTVGVPKVQRWFAKLTPLRQKVAPNAPIQLPLARQAEAAEAVPPTTRRAAAHGRRRRGATPSTEDTPQDIMVGKGGSMRGRLNGCGGASACCSGSVM